MRMLVLFFDVAAVAAVIYLILDLAKRPIRVITRNTLIAGAVFLLFAPLLMIVRLVPPTPVFFMVYPLVIGVYYYFAQGFKE